LHGSTPFNVELLIDDAQSDLTANVPRISIHERKGAGLGWEPVADRVHYLVSHLPPRTQDRSAGTNNRGKDRNLNNAQTADELPVLNYGVRIGDVGGEKCFGCYPTFVQLPSF